MRPRFSKELEVKDMAKALKAAKTSNLVRALNRLECDLIYGEVYLPGGYVYPGIDKIYAELEQRPQVNLAKIHPRQLLSWLRNCHGYSGWWYPGGIHQDLCVSAEALKKELATRPHLPNKKEGRLNRQKAARNAKKGKQRYSHR